MNPFEKALLDAVNEEFDHIPHESDLDFAPLSLKKAQKSTTLRRCLLVAAVCILLASGVFAAYTIQYRMGQVEIETDVTKIFDFVSELDDDGNNYHSITFTEDFSNPNAPDKIEVFYLPKVDAGDVQHGLPNWYVESTGIGVYHPFSDRQWEGNDTDPKDYDKILAEPTAVYYTWDTFTREQISFSQYLAKDATDGTPFMNISYRRDARITAYTETIEIDEYSIFAFNLDMTALDIGDGKSPDISRNWFWTNGDYVFVLTAGLSVEEMTELFRSVRPVSTSYPYTLTTSESGISTVEENFDLIG